MESFNKNDFTRISSLIIFFVFLLLGLPLNAAPHVYEAGDEDVAIINDQGMTPLNYMWTKIVMGNFYGSSQTDLAIFLKDEFEPVHLFRGPLTGKNMTFSQDSALRVLNSSLRVFNVEFADLNANGRMDFIMNTDSGPEVLFDGRTLNSYTVGETVPDLRIVAEPTNYLGTSFVRGDFIGDAGTDLFIGGTAQSYIVNSSTNFLSGATLDLTVSTGQRVLIPWGSSGFSSGGSDINLQGKEDLLVSQSTHVINIYWGKSEYTGVPTPDVQITGPYWPYSPAQGDLNGGGRPELLVLAFWGAPTYFGVVVDGVKLMGTTLLDLQMQFSLPQLPLQINNTANAKIGDFDGDGKNDVILVGSPQYQSSASSLVAYLSSDRANPNSLDHLFDNPSFYWRRPFEYITLADVNKDGLMDIVAYDNLGTISPYGVVRIMYGFRPLSAPRVTVETRPSGSAHGRVALSVGGDPVEMKISGDIVDDFKDTWIPYRTSLDVTFTSEEGEKKVRAIFRNGSHRESAVAEGSSPSATMTQSLVVRTNWVSPGDRAELECSLTETGRIKAVVYNRSGEKVKVLMDEVRGPGIWPIEWDGQNSEGNFVSPGFYVLVVDSAGQTTKTTIVVQK